MAGEKRKIGYDYLRVIAIIMVVIIHGMVIFDADGTVETLAVTAIGVICLISVPCFLMISGALLLELETQSPLRTVKHRIVKQGAPFFVWSLVYVVARMMMGKIPIGIQAFTALLHEPAYYQFWFMYTLLAIYLLLPILINLVRHISKQVYEYLLSLWFLFSVLQPTLECFFPALRLSQHVDLVICEGYLGYFLLGHYLKKYGNEIRIKKAVSLLVCGCLLTGTLIWAEYAFSIGGFQGYFYRSYLTPGVTLASIGVFLIVQNVKFAYNSVIVYLSNLSIGVFYIHMLILTAFEYAGLSGANSIILCIVKCFSVYGISVLIASCISKIPVLKRMLLAMS